MSDLSNTYIVIPVFNEAPHIQKVYEGLRAEGYENIVFVDDGSTDETYKKAKRLTTVLRHPINRGYGASLTTGTNYAIKRNAEIVVHFDGDGQHLASEVKRVIQPLLDDKADVVFGSRYLSPDSKLPKTKQYLIHMPALFLQRIITGLKFTDIHNGFRAFNKTALSKIIMHQDRMAYSSEIISELKRKKLRFKEVPVTVIYNEYGQNFLSGFKIYKDLILKKIFK